MSNKNRILAVEDDTVGQIIISGMLSNLGYSVDIVSSGYDAIARFTEHEYDLVFMDCLMPGMDGMQATQKIREIEKLENRSHRSVIIALTAMAMSGDREQCLASGMDDYLPKPLEMDDLKKTLNKYLSKISQ